VKLSLCYRGGGGGRAHGGKTPRASGHGGKNPILITENPRARATDPSNRFLGPGRGNTWVVDKNTPPRGAFGS